MKKLLISIMAIPAICFSAPSILPNGAIVSNGLAVHGTLTVDGNVITGTGSNAPGITSSTLYRGDWGNSVSNEAHTAYQVSGSNSTAIGVLQGQVSSISQSSAVLRVGAQTMAGPLTVQGPAIVGTNLGVYGSAQGGEQMPTFNGNTNAWLYSGFSSNNSRLVLADGLSGVLTPGSAPSVTNGYTYRHLFTVDAYASTSTIVLSHGGRVVTNVYAGSAGATYTNDVQVYDTTIGPSVTVATANGQLIVSGWSVKQLRDGRVFAGSEMGAPIGRFANVESNLATGPVLRTGSISTGWQTFNGIANNWKYVSFAGGTMQNVLATTGAVQGVDTYGAKQSGYSRGLMSQGEQAHGAQQSGYTEGTMSQGEGSYGAQQNGGSIGIMMQGMYSIGAQQNGYAVGIMSQDHDSYGAQQNGYVDGTMSQGIGSYGAQQNGRVNSGYYATNNGVGSLQLLNLTNGNALMTGNASIGLNAVTVTNDSAIVTGDGNVSHGTGTITANGYWIGNTNLLTLISGGGGGGASTNQTVPAAIGSIGGAWTINYSAGAVQYMTVTSAVTSATITGLMAGASGELTLYVANPTMYSVTWPASGFAWLNGNVGTFTTNGWDRFILTTFSNATTAARIGGS